MCQFISWVEYKDKNYYLTHKELNTKEGRALLKKCQDDDVRGHGVIREYYPELKNRGENKECSDFSTPENFPEDIVKSIKKGDFERIGICPKILTKSALAEYQKIEQPAWAEYQKIEQPAWAEYQKIEQPAWAEYQKIKQSAFWKIARIKKNRIKIWR